jgi:hypothetical protein
MLNEDDFANINSSSRDTIKYIPPDWYQIIENAQRKNMFTVKKWTRGLQIHNTSIKMWAKNEDGEPDNQQKIQWIKFQTDFQYFVFYKETLNKDFPLSKLT